jgi:hypothetical protein
MAFKVKIIGLHQGCFITLVRKECERLENEPKQKECITLVFEKEQSFACVSLCIFITGASLTVRDIADMQSQDLCILHQIGHGGSTSPHTTHVRLERPQASVVRLGSLKVNHLASPVCETQKLKQGRGLIVTEV